MPSIIFYVNIIRQARCIRRIEDFIAHGFNVKVYGFDRAGDNRKLPDFDYEILGTISKTQSYSSRLLMMKKAIDRSLKQNPASDQLFYLFNFDVALAFLMNPRTWKSRYLYEVSDLMELTLSNPILSKTLARINKTIISHSFETVFTSEGFIPFFYDKKNPANLSLLPNKLNKRCENWQRPTPQPSPNTHFKIGFAGAIRSKAVLNFAKIVGEQFPEMELLFYGIFTDDGLYSPLIRSTIEQYENLHFLGPFRNPDDFPTIYENIDLVLSLYSNHGNDRYLEPNKYYEALFFAKPIIVSIGTYIGEKVTRQNVGFAIDGENEQAIIDFLKSLNAKDCYQKAMACSQIPTIDLLDHTDSFFKKLQDKI